MSVRSLTAPAFAPLRPWLARLPADRFPDCAELNRLLGGSLRNASGQPLRCVPPSCADAAEAYESRAWRSGEIITRPDNWHDLFNALAWCVFPHAKGEINAQHAARLAAPHAPRGTARDVLTLFDEDGIVVPCASRELAGLLTGFQWRALFVEHREDVRRHMDFCIVGHALYDKMRAPFFGVTAKALLLEVEQSFFDLQRDERVDRLDAMVAARLRDPDTLRATQRLAPLPVLGIPGWCEDNERPEYYDDERQFRPGRRRAALSAGHDA